MTLRRLGAEFLIPRPHRRYTTNGLVCSTGRPLTKSDIVVVQGFRCLTAERLIIESPLFGFTTAEIENAIDSSIRLRLVAETAAPHTRRARAQQRNQRRSPVCSTHSSTQVAKVGSSVGSSASSGAPVSLDRSYRRRTRDGTRIRRPRRCLLSRRPRGRGRWSREPHASRRQIQLDAQRRTELTLRGLRVITFTYNDVRDRPDWVIAQLREALALAA